MLANTELIEKRLWRTAARKATKYEFAPFTEEHCKTDSLCGLCDHLSHQRILPFHRLTDFVDFSSSVLPSRLPPQKLLHGYTMYRDIVTGIHSVHHVISVVPLARIVQTQTAYREHPQLG